MTVIARKFNPGFLSDEELVETFCVRKAEYLSLVEALRDCAGNANSHQIVIGPRGSGKTTLLLRVAAEVPRDTDLSARFFPIVFAEESYEVSTAGEFWLECVSRLVDQAPCQEQGVDLQRTFEELRKIRDDQSLEGRCLGVLQDFADREAKRLVLIVENLNMMFGDMGDDSTGWRLRKVMQTDPRIVILASATSKFDEISNPEKALYELFRVIQLRPLDTEDCANLWRTVSGQEQVPETIQALRILTGGSPRLLTIVARFGANMSFGELMADLLDLVDDHTEYFKSHLDALPSQERKVYLALAGLWKPANAREIADRSRLGTSKCSSQLARLINRGAVEVSGGSARRKLYYLTERLYNIYYLMRRARGSAPLIDALVRFMEAYYSTDELRELGVRMAQEAPGIDGSVLIHYRMAFEHLVRLPSLKAYRKDLLSLGPPTFAIAAEEHSTDSSSASVLRKLFNRAKSLSESGQLKEALSAWDEIIKSLGQSEGQTDHQMVANALVNKGVALGQLGRTEEELLVWDNLERLFGNSDNPNSLWAVAVALVNKGATLGQLNQPEQALEVYDEFLRRYGNCVDSYAHEAVALALVNKGTVLVRMSQLEEALSVWDEVLRRFGNGDVPALRSTAEFVMCVKAELELAMGRSKSAIAMLNRLLRQDWEGFLGYRLLGHLIRARAHLAEGDVKRCNSDVETGLSFLSDSKTLTKDVLKALMTISVGVGPEKMCDLIKSSPAGNLLLPFRTALELELGLEPRVAREVEEVAEDIRQDLQTLSKRTG